HRGLSARHIPERSGLPSAVRCVGAFKFGFPSGVRGVPGSGSDNHCAEAVADVKISTISARLSDLTRFALRFKLNDTHLRTRCEENSDDGDRSQSLIEGGL